MTAAPRYQIPPLDVVDPGARLLHLVNGGRPETGGPPWPTLDPAAMHGLPGDFVRLNDPHTEADPAAVLFVFLATAGWYLGPGYYLKAGGVRHPSKIWPIIVGDTATGAKGTAIGVGYGFWFDFDRDLTINGTASGLSSGEGLIRAVRDPNGADPDAAGFDEGVADKRLWVDAPEFASVLERSRREGNSLSAILREAYDTKVLQTLTSGSPLRSTDSHIVVTPQITPAELVAKLNSTDVANGLANRFVPVCSRMSKLLPDGGEPPESEMKAFGNRLALTRAHLQRESGGRGYELKRTPAAYDLWDVEYRRRFAERANESESPVLSLTARWHPHAARLSLIYALLDGALEIDEPHVRAGLAAWDYVEASIRHIFGSEAGDRDLGRLLEFIDQSVEGRTRGAISTELFQRNKTKKELDLLLEKLLNRGGYEVAKSSRVEGQTGRTPLVYRRTEVGRGH